jgi:succinoglycan exporter
MAVSVSFQLLLGSTFWLMVANALSLGMRGLIMPVLARLLTPEEFGIVGTSIAILMLFAVVSTNGMPAALVARGPTRREDPGIWSTVFWAQLATAAVLTGVIIALASPLATFLDTPRVAPVLVALSGVFVLMCLNACLRAELFKAMRFRALAVVEVMAHLIGATAAIAAAFAGFGLWALVALYYTTTSLNGLGLLVMTRFRPSWQFDGRRLVAFLPFALRTVFSDLCMWISTRSPVLIVANLDGITAAGAWTASQQFVRLPNRIIAKSATEVLFPAFASLKGEHKRLAAGFRTSTHAAVLLQTPLLFGLWAVAEPAMVVIFGQNWGWAWPILGLLALATGLNASSLSIVSFLKGIDRTDRLLQLSVLQAFFVSVAAVVGATLDGATGAALAVAVTRGIYNPIALVYTLRLAELPPLTNLLVMLRPMFAAAVMAVTVRHVLEDWVPFAWSPLSSLVVGVTLGALIYTALVFAVDGEGRQLVKRLLRRRR